MFNTKKKKIRGFIAIALCAATTLSLAACKANPDSSIVVNKDLDKLVEQAENSEADGLILDREYDTYKKTLEDESLRVKVNIDAKVDVPKTDKMSMLRVSQQKVSQELLDAVRRELLGDTTLYDGGALMKMTKSDIEQTISDYRMEMEGFDRNTEEGAEGYREYQSMIDELENAYNSAPTDISFKGCESNGKFQSVADKYNADTTNKLYSWLNQLSSDGDEVFYGVSDGSDGNYSSLYAINSTEQSNYISFRKGKHGYEKLGVSGFTPEMFDGSMERTPITDETANLTLEKAVGIADGFLEKVGINNSSTEFRYYDGGLTTEELSIEKNCDLEGVPTRTYYVLTYMRYIGGAFITPGGEDKMNAGENDGTFSKMVWPTEKIEFRINDSGIVGFDYIAPISITETVVDKSAMKSYDTVRNTFEKMIMVTNASEYSDVQIDIDRVTLGYAMISEPNSYATGLLVPAWDFIGTKSLPYFAEKGEEAVERNQPCLTINAIDGSIVDRQLGY